MSKTILVTGGAGFLGSHLCEFLLEKGHHVICLDNFFTGNKENIAHLVGKPNFEIIRHDICREIFIEVDEIYNLACPASPVHYQYNPIKTIKTCTVGMTNMLGLAKRCKAKIFQASTSEVYGDPLEHPQRESYYGHVNILGPRSCFSKDTEVLTKEGFKFFKDLKKEDKILTLNNEHFIEYHKPFEIIKQKYVGELIEFKSAKIDLQVTPNHNMYVRPRDDLKKKKFRLIKAFESINWKRAEMLKSANWGGKEKEYFHLPPVKNSKFGNVSKIKMDDWLEFFGYYITEGCVHYRKRIRKVNNKDYQTIDYNILIAQDRKHKEEREKIEACLKKLPFTYFNSDHHQFRICNKQLGNYLLRFGKSKEKFVLEELKNLSKRQLKILFKAMMLGDGSKDGVYYTSSPKLAGDFQEIVLKLGMAATMYKPDKRKPNSVYHLHILKNDSQDFSTPIYPERKIVKYNGFIYCVNVKNHLIYIRRNGKALFCGNCYDEGKRVAESLCVNYHKQNNVVIRIARIFNTYGPRMALNDGRVVSNFIISALKGKDIEIYGDGTQTRSFCYVGDMIEGFYKLMNSESTGPINLGNPVEMSMLQLAQKIKELTGSASQIAFPKQLPENDPKKRQPDITLAKEKLEWQPTTSLDEGLSKTIAYFKEKLKL